jgi:excisionase family DNA binding protein
MNTAPEFSAQQLLTFAQAAEHLGISLRQFRRLVDGGKLPFVRIGQRTPRIRPADLKTYLDASVVSYAHTS